MENKNSAAHNLFFQCFLQEQRLAEIFLRAYLPANLTDRINFATLQPAGGELIPTALKKLPCDVLLLCQLNQSTERLYLLTEHQLSPNQLIALRIPEYVTALMRRHLKQGNKGLPLILPLVVYHGTQAPYPFDIRLWDNLNHPKLACSLMLKPFQLVDLSVMPDEIIKTHGPVAIVEWLLRDATVEGEIFLKKAKQHLTHPLGAGMLENFSDFRLATFNYILNAYRGGKSAHEVVNELIQALPEEEQMVLTAARKLEKR